MIADELRGEATRRPDPSNTKTLFGSSTASSTCPAGNSVGEFDLVGAEPDAIGAVGKTGIKPRCRRLHAAGILNGAAALFDPYNVQRRIGKHLRDTQSVGMAIDVRGL